MNTLSILNKKNRETTKDIHKRLGVDFEKPFDLIEFDSEFTINKLKKAAAARGYETNNSLVLALIDDPFWSGRFQAVRITNKGYDIDPLDGYTSGVDHFHTKSDFEEKRKGGRLNGGYILCQKKEYLLPVKKHSFRWHEYEPTTTDRYKFKRFRHQQHVELMRTDNNGEIFELTIYNGINADNYNEYIDKSGYYIEGVRQDLKQRLKQYKANKKKSEYLAVDFSAKIEALKQLIDAKKTVLVFEFSQAKTAEQIEKIRDKMGYHGLWGAMRDFERMIEMTNEKSYSSIESFENNYRTITDVLAGI